MSLAAENVSSNPTSTGRHRERHDDARVSTACLFGLCVLLLASGAQALAADTYEVNTPVGRLSTRPGTASECRANASGASECKVMELAGRILFADWSVSVDGVVPGPGDPKLVFASQWSGGNACCWVSYLIDLTRSEPVVVKSAPPLNRDNKEARIEAFPKGVTYQNYGEGEGPLGEPLWEVYRYLYGSGKVEVLRSLPKYSYSAMDSKKYPNEVLDDPVKREPLLKVMSKADFKELRRRVEVRSPLQRASDTIFVGQGGMAHSGGISEGIFVIDVARNKAWAMYFEKASGKFFGSLSPDDAIPRRVFEHWMSEHKMLWSQFAVAPGSADAAALATAAPGTRTEVPLVREAGVLKVPVTLNGVIPLTFVVDSGASDVSIPADVMLTLIRTGTLTEADFIGTKIYRLADGSTFPSRTFRIRTLRVGDQLIENVTGSTTGAEGVLLLGQSFLGRFRRWSINNSTQALELE